MTAIHLAVYKNQKRGQAKMEIKQICDDAMKYGTASVCIPPCYVKKATGY